MNPFKKNCWSKIVCKTDNNNSIFRDEFQFEIWLERNFTEFWGWRNKKLFTFAIRFNCGGKFIHSEVFELNRNFLIENILKFLVISMCFEWHYWTLNLRGLIQHAGEPLKRFCSKVSNESIPKQLDFQLLCRLNPKSYIYCLHPSIYSKRFL